MSADCHFCKLPPERIWLATEHALAFPDSFPISLGHPLVIPVHHIASVFDLSEAQRGTLWALVAKVRVAIHERLRPDGFNIGVNGWCRRGADNGSRAHSCDSPWQRRISL
jgi:diadenosine tetraphosphate (Ap4A) HIT family hydrolase